MGLVELGYLPGITIFKTILASSFITEVARGMQTDSKQKTNAKKHATLMVRNILHIHSQNHSIIMYICYRCGETTARGPYAARLGIVCGPSEGSPNYF